MKKSDILLHRKAALCAASLRSEGWRLIAEFRGQYFLKHSNGSKARIIISSGIAMLYINNKLKKILE